VALCSSEHLQNARLGYSRAMKMIHRLILLTIGLAVAAPLVAAQDLSEYRTVRLGMNVAAVAEQVGVKPSEATLIHRRPAVIQELISRSSQVGVAARPDSDPVQNIVFTFYDDQLFRIVATYDRAKIAGLTDKDLIDSMSTRYGAATIPPATVTSARFSQAYPDNSEQVVARWEDAEYSVNLVRSSYGSSTSLVMFSKHLDTLARTAVSEALRLDALEAPARQAERQAQQDTDARAAQDKDRLANKPTFRP
jgi:hypothetical protein